MRMKSPRALAEGAGRLLDRIHATAAILAVITLFALTVLITANVIMRGAGGAGIRGIIEINEILIAAIAYLAIAVAQRERQHVAITAATAFLSPHGQSLATRLGVAIALFYVSVATWESGWMAAESYLSGEARWGLISVPVWPGRIVVALGFAMLGAELLRQVIVGDKLPPIGSGSDPTPHH